MGQVSERALTVRDVAALYGVTSKCVYGWIKDGHIRPIRLPGGGPYRFRRSDLEEFETRCRGGSSSDQTTGSDSEEPAGMLTLQTLGVATLDPYQRGRLSAPKPRGGGTNG